MNSPLSFSSISFLLTKFLKLQKKSTSIFASANRELTSNPLELIEKLLSDEKREESVNEKIFGSRESVKKFIESESKKISKFLKFIFILMIESIFKCHWTNSQSRTELLFSRNLATLWRTIFWSESPRRLWQKFTLPLHLRFRSSEFSEMSNLFNIYILP